MLRKLYKDSVNLAAFSFSIFCLLFIGHASANKEGYYGKYIGKLSQLHHGVSGDVFAVDARTLHIRNFNYDGEGPAAYFYAGSSKAPGVNGFRLRDERGTTNVLPRYRNKHITVTLPEGKTLQNIRWFSVWCDEFSVNFGDVKIPKNLDFPKPQKIAGLSGVHGVSSEPIVIVDAQTLLIPSFSYDGEAPDAKFWVGRGFKPSPQGIRIPDENGKELPLRRYDRKTIVLTLPGDLTIFDIGHFGVWCEAFTVDFGHVQIPRGLNIPPSLKMLGVSPQSKLNCEVLWDDFAYEVRWAVAGDSIVLQLVARLEDNEYMSFGLSGDHSRSRMVGGDVVVAWVDKDSLKGYAKDYYLDAKSQCSGGRGSCPDENIEVGADSVRLLNAALVNGYSIVTFQRSLKAQDDLDKEVFINSSQPIIWAVGPLNSRKEVSYHSLANRGDIFIDFGRAPKWNCPTPEAISDQSEPEEPSVAREQEAKTQDSRIQADPNRRESRPKVQIPTPAPAPKTAAWEIPSIKCYEPEDGVFYAQMGPTGGKHGYSAITGHVGWGISWYINGLLIPEINVVRGRTYTFIVEGGLDPETPARYHPFYITDDPVGGYQYKTPQERANIQIFAGAVQNKRGEVRPTGVGRLCNWTPDPSAPPADEFSSFGAYQRTLRLECDPGNPGIIQWTVEKDTPDTVYYQCYTHRYLGWKINVHDHCEGEAASNPVPSVVKAPPSVIKEYEVDSQGSESINFETRVKPDAELLKSILEKNQTTYGLNQLVSHVSTNKLHHELFKGKRVVFQEAKQNFHFPQVGAPLRQQNAVQTSFLPEMGNGIVKFSTLSLPAKPSGYRVTEEPSEGTQENFQIIPIQGPFINGLQNHQQLSPGEPLRIQEQVKVGEPLRIQEQVKVGDRFQDDYTRNRDIQRPQAEEKPKRKNQKPPFHSKVTGRLPGGPGRLRKPLPSSPLTLQQRPFPPGVFRPPVASLKTQSRPPTPGSPSAIHHFQTKSAKPLHHFNVPLGPEGLIRQESQPLRQIKRPNKNHQVPAFSFHDSFGSSTVSKSSSQGIPLAKHNGFDPQSVQVEGGFKPILNTGIAPKPSLVERSDSEVSDTAEDGVGVIDLIKSRGSGEFLVKNVREKTEDEKTEVVRNRDKGVDLFKNQKPQTFEPIFIPSHPDDSLKKYPEKHKKKPLSLKPRFDQFKQYGQQSGEEIHVKVRPATSVIRRPLYPDSVMPPFRIPQHGKAPQLRSHHLQYDNSTDAAQIDDVGISTSSGNSKAGNILEVLEMDEGKNNRKEENKTSTTEGHEASLRTESRSSDAVQDEIAMADERKEFYLPPKADEFLSYDGKVVKAVEAPALPQSSPRADLSKLPQFGPFRGVIPPLAQEVNAESLPQLKSSILARHDILPPATPDSEGAVPGASHFLSREAHERQKRAPDHIPGHEGHDHSDNNHHHHHHHHNSGSANVSSLFHVGFISFILMCLQRHTLL